MFPIVIFVPFWFTSQDLERLEEVCCDLEFIEARFEAGQGNDCVADFRMAVRGESTPLIHALSKVKMAQSIMIVG